MAVVWCAGRVVRIAHLGLVELSNHDDHAVPRLHPTVGDGRGAHTVTLLLLKLRGALARLLRLGLALLLRLLLVIRSCLRSTVLVSTALVIRAIHLVAGVTARLKALLPEAPRLLEHLEGRRRVTAFRQLVGVHAGGSPLVCLLRPNHLRAIQALADRRAARAD